MMSINSRRPSAISLKNLEKLNAPPPLILYPPSVSSEPAHISEMLLHGLHSLGNDDVSVAERNLGFLPVSPWEISSVERSARALRWVSMGRFLQQYPPRIETPPPAELKTGQVFEWLKPDPEQKSYEVICLPRVDQERLLKVDEVEQDTEGETEEDESFLFSDLAEQLDSLTDDRFL